MKNYSRNQIQPDDKLFPVSYEGRLWKEEDCNDVFLSFYHCRESLNALGGVYLSEGIWVYPDGKMEHW
jgi:hypothetical protein